MTWWAKQAERNTEAVMKEGGSFVEERCKCDRVWRGKPGSNPASACPDCGEEMAADAKWRRENHYP